MNFILYRDNLVGRWNNAPVCASFVCTFLRFINC